MSNSYLNRKNLLQGLTLSATVITLLTVIIFGFILEGPNTARLSFIAMLICFGLFVLASSQYLNFAIHLFNLSSFIFVAGLMLITPQVNVTIIFLVPLFLVNLFYRPRTVLILSILSFVLINIYALTYVQERNTFIIDDLVAQDIVSVSLIIFMLLAAYLRETSEKDSEKSRQELKVSEERFRQMVTNSPNFIAIYDVSKRSIQSWNVSNYLGYPIEQIIGRDNWDKVIHSDSAHIMPEIRKVLTSTTDINASYELKVNSKEGEESWLNYQISTLQKATNGDVVLRLITLSDITALKQVEQQKLQEDLEKQKAEMIDTVVSGFSHEFRTPLATIETNLYMLQNLHDSDKSNQYIGKARTQIKRIVNLTDQLNILIRLRNQAELTLNRVAINELVESCIKRNQHHIEAKKLTLETDYMLVKAYSLMDVNLMNILMNNLLDNAIKFTEENGKIIIKTETHSEWAKIIIEDDGVGISETMLEDIYDLFSREDKSHSRVGLGIGLSIVKAIADSHDHQLNITSRADCCTTVELTIPIVP